MREHRTAHAIADRVDALDTRTAFVVDHDEAPLIELDAGIVREQAIRYRATADGDDEFVDGQFLRTVAVFVLDLDVLLARRRFADLGTEPDIEPLLLEFRGRDLGDVTIGHEQEVVHGLEDRHLRTETRPHTAKLETDNAGADGRTLVRDDEYLRTSILQPNEHVVEGYLQIMPTFQGQISEVGLQQLITYIKSLGGGEAAQSAAALPAADTIKETAE